MFFFRRLVPIFCFALLAAGVFAPTALAQDPEAGQVAWEEETSCQRCHGPDAAGSWAGPLAGTDNSAQEWIDQVRNPRRNMPAYAADKVTDEQIINMHAYVASLPEVTEFAPMDAGLPADAPEGQQLMVDKRCAACHSTQGPINGFIERGEIPTVETISTQVRTPRNNMPIYSAEQVSDAEMAAITDFLAQEVSAQLEAAPAESAEATESTEEMAAEAESMAAPEEQPAEAPATLPVSGGSQSLPWPVMLLIIGGFTLVGGLTLRLVTR